MPCFPQSLGPLVPSPSLPSYNQGAKWGVTNFGTLSAFDFQPKNAGYRFKAINENSKS